MTPAEMRTFRTRMGFPTWEAAAAAIGVSRATVFRYLSGRTPIPEPVALLCRCLTRSERARNLHDGS